MTERGVYVNADRGRQLLRFDGFQYGSITPTDIDGIIDYHDQIWVMFEAKLSGKELPKGQRMALERLIKNAKRASRHGIAMIVEHTVDNPKADIILKDCNVREIYTTERPNWRPPRWRITAKEMADAYINYFANMI